MKLTAEQIQQIDAYLVKDKIFYDDIRLELIDHIASHFENTLQPGDDFTQTLKSYMNSYQKVKLLTAARVQEKVRDGYYRRYFLKQFVTPKGALTLIIVFLVIYLGMQSGVWMKRICEAGFIILILWHMTGLKGLKSPFIQRIKEEIQLYYLIPVIIISQGKRVFDDSLMLYYLDIFGFGMLFVSVYFVYLTHKKYKFKSHA